MTQGSPDIPKPAGKTSRRRRRWWQRLCRYALLAAMVLTTAYVLLPWWLPKEMLRGYLARQMQARAGTAVEIGGLSVSWEKGVEIRALSVASPGSFDPQPALQVESLRADFSPLTLLVRNRLDWVEIESPRVYMQINERGDLSTLPLTKLFTTNEGDDATQVRQISLSRGSLTVRFPHEERLLTFDVNDMQLVAGRVQRLGRVTMSAGLRQDGRVAPVGLNLAAETPRPGIAAAAAFSFSDVDLAQLRLPELLNLPLRQLGGRCGGSLDLEINDQGSVDKFDFNLTVHNLDVRPIEGQRLVVAEAGVRLNGTGDLVPLKVEVRQASVCLPGIDLAGQVKMFAGVGSVPGIQSLDLDGEIRPAPLAAFLTGRPELPMGLAVEGPLATRLTVEDDNSRFALRFSVDGTRAVIRQGSQTLKAAGVPLAVRLSGGFDRQNWQLALDQSELVLGGNRCSGRGSLQNLQQTLERLASAPEPLPVRTVLESFADLDWQGSWELTELDSLRAVSPALAALLEKVKLRGRIEGFWSLRHPADTRLTIDATVPSQTRLAIGGFVKPEGTAITLDFDATVLAPELAMKNVELDLSVGAGRFLIDRGRVELTPGTEAKRLSADVTGRWEAENLASLVACFPAVAGSAGQVDGGMEGEYAFHLAPGALQASFSADFAQARFAIGDFLTKPAGRKTAVAAEFVSDAAAPEAERNRLRLTADTEQASAEACFVFPRVQDVATGSRLKAAVRIRDAAWLAESSPRLRKMLAGGRMSGPASLSADVVVSDSAVHADLACEADGAEFALGGPARRSKAAGVPLSASLSCELRRGENGRLTASLPSGTLVVDHSAVKLQGRAELSPEETAPAGAVLWADGLHVLEARVEGQLAASPALWALAPELAAPAKRWDAKGRLDAELTVRGDRENISLRGRADATALDFALLRVAARTGARAEAVPASQSRGVSPGEAHAEHAPVRAATQARAVVFAKPADLPAVLEIEATVPTDLARVQINNFFAKAGDVELLASGSAKVKPAAGNEPAQLTQKNAHFTLWIKDARTLARCLPDLAPYSPSGEATLEAEWSDTDGGTLPYARLTLNGLQGQYAGKNLLGRGEVLAERVLLRHEKDGKAHVGRLKTDDLEFRVGEKNHGWVIADLSRLPEAPAGTLQLLAEKLDDRDLSEWLSPPAPQPTKAPRLTDKETRALEQAAQEWIARAREYAAAADLTVRLSAERFTSYDAQVRQTYDAHDLEVEATAKQGAVAIQEAVGVNGGTLRMRMETRLGDATPEVSRVTNIAEFLGAPNVQPQLARYFPGNTVYGTFSRDEQIVFPLRNMLAQAMDARYPLRPRGTGRTVTVDGMVEGRAAPAPISNIFPGLNLSQYHYDRMTAFADFLPDGSTRNDMIFNGRPIDIYMEGATDANNIGRYEIGVILLSRPQSPEGNHTYRQGRIPLLNFKARIEDGRMQDVEVSYLRPDEVLSSILLKNNLVYRLWLKGQQK